MITLLLFIQEHLLTINFIKSVHWLNSVIGATYHPSKTLSVDESMIPSKADHH